MASGLSISEASSIFHKQVKKTTSLTTADQFAEYVCANTFDQGDSRAHLKSMVKQALQHYKGDI